MARFFVDSDDGSSAIVDDEGFDLADADADAARKAARHALHDMARDYSEQVGRRLFTVLVRDEAGKSIYRASLIFEGERYA
jgi:bifunctional DNase/RNase